SIFAHREQIVDLLHPPAQIIDDAPIIRFVFDHSRGDEKHQFGTIVLELLVAEKAAEYRDASEERQAGGTVLLVLEYQTAHHHRLAAGNREQFLHRPGIDRRRVARIRGRARDADFGLDLERYQAARVDVRRYLQQDAG